MTKLLCANADPRFVPISVALPVFSNTFVVNIFNALAEASPKFLENLPTPSASVVLPLLAIDFFPLHIEHLAVINLISFPVFLLKVTSAAKFVVAL